MWLARAIGSRCPVRYVLMCTPHQPGAQEHDFGKPWAKFTLSQNTFQEERKHAKATLPFVVNVHVQNHLLPREVGQRSHFKHGRRVSARARDPPSHPVQRYGTQKSLRSNHPVTQTTFLKCCGQKSESHHLPTRSPPPSNKDPTEPLDSRQHSAFTLGPPVKGTK